MASIRIRHWGRGKVAFVVDYIDLDSKRRLQTFKSERAASAFKAAIEYALRVEANVTSFKTPPPPECAANDLSADLLWGAEAIGEFLGLPPRVAYYRLTNGTIPGKKVGHTWTASKRRLRDSLT